jgi:hypothetical protein
MSEHTRKSNLKLKTNLICTKKEGLHNSLRRRLDVQELAPRLTYFELRMLARANPILFSPRLYEPERLSETQARYRDAFLEDLANPLGPSVTDELSPISVLLPARSKTPERLKLPIKGEPVTPPVGENAPTFSTVPPPAPVPHPDPGADESIDLQRKVIEAGPKTDLLIFSAPGTGKTHVLIERLAHLLNSGAFENPAEEVLVLSFTRAAVSEIKRRLAERIGRTESDDLRYVTVSTFDSFATHALLELQEEFHDSSASVGSNEESSYDRRIRSLTRKLQSTNVDETLPPSIRKLKYLVVDEIQDLVCARAAMVLALSERVHKNQGVVFLLGDPAQAIYDYQTRKQACVEAIDSRVFLNRISELLPSAQKIEFRRSYRFATPQLEKLATRTRKAMGRDGSSADAEALLSSVYDAGPGPYTMAELPAWIRTHGGGALLVRSNADAHQVVSWCKRNGIPAIRNRGTRGGEWPHYLGRVFFRWKQKEMSIESFERRWQEHIHGQCEATFDEAIGFLENARLIRNSSIDVRRLRRQLNNTSPPQSALPANTLLVSTVHRAKGLEYDAVLLLESGGTINNTEELRIVYVAATRARRHFSMLNRERGIFKTMRFGSGRYPRTGNLIYLDGSEDLDSDLLSPSLESSLNPEQRQLLLWDTFHAAGGRTGFFIRSRTRDNFEYFTLAMQTREGDFCDIAECNPDLRQALFKARNTVGKMGQHCHGWPVEVRGLITIAFDPNDELATEQFGEPGLALIPALAGSLNLSQDRRS